MKFIAAGVLAAALVTGPLAAQQVSVAEGDWSDIPEVLKRGQLRVSTEAVDRIAAVAARGECPVIGDAQRIRMSVPFLMEFSQNGALQQVVVWKINCPEVESVVGGTLLQMAKSGEYRPTGENQVGWYRGDFQLTANN